MCSNFSHRYPFSNRFGQNDRNFLEPERSTIRKMPHFRGTLFENQVDIAVICARSDTELQSVREAGKNSWKPLPSTHDDPSSYVETEYCSAWGQTLRVVSAATTQMGMPASAILATKMIRRFRPRLVAMVGIAAGANRNNQNYGDILVPTQTFDYNAGKITIKDGKLHFEPDFAPLSLSERLRSRLQEWATDWKRLNNISNRWRSSGQLPRLAIHIGPLASGAAVIDTSQPVLDVVEHWRKLVGIEMEAYGVHLACHGAICPQPEFLCIKSISDFATNKNDEWRDYAAYTAAEFFHAFVTEEWESLFPPPEFPEGAIKNWEDGLRVENHLGPGVLKIQIHNVFAKSGNASGGVWLQHEDGLNLSCYRRIGLELRCRKGIDYALEIKIETPDGVHQHQVIHEPLETFGRENEWLKVVVDIDKCHQDILTKVGRIVFGAYAMDLPCGQEIDIDVRRVVFLR